MIKVILIDDEPLAVSVVREYLKYHTDFEIVGECHNGFEGIKSIQLHQPDLIFLDVQMPKINGFEMLEVTDHRPHVIFTTAFDQYAIKAFETHAVDYLLKPFTFERFFQAVEKAKLFTTKQDSGEIKYIFIKTEYRLEKIMLQDILYIEGMRDYRRIFLKDKDIMTLQTFKELEEMIPAHVVCRVHKSYMVGIDKIESIEKERIKIGSIRIPVSETYKKNFMQLIGRS